MIKFQFVLGPDLASKAIAWFSAGHFSHVDLLLDDGGLLGARSDSVGGKPPGVQVRCPNYAKWPERVVMGLDCTATQKACALNFAYAQLNKPYDKTAILGFAVGRNWRERDSWFCSELGGAILEYSGILPKLYTPSNKLTPGGLALAVSAAGGQVQ